MVTGSDVAQVKRAVLRVMGGRAYSGHVPATLRRDVMRERARGSRLELDRAALGAHAVANYLRDIGDVASAQRWAEMSEDLSIVARER